MPERMQKITPFQQGQATNEHPDKTKSAPVTSEMQSTRKPWDAGLMRAFGHKGMPPTLPAQKHMASQRTTSKPRGALYSPAGEFGSMRRTHTPNSTYSYGGAPNKRGDNPLGSPQNKKGDNALGKAMNRVGTNVLGKPSNRKGTNVMGKPQNRRGSNAAC